MNPTIILEIADKNHLSSKHKDQKPAKPRNYLNNRDLLSEIALSKSQGKMSNKLAHMLQTLCKRYASKGSYSGYTYNDDMQSYAMLQLCTSWCKFNEKLSSNPFAYYTQCIKSSFAQYLNSEKKQRVTRDMLLVEGGMSPSYTFQIEYSQDKRGRDVNIVETSHIDEYGSFDYFYAVND